MIPTRSRKRCAPFWLCGVVSVLIAGCGGTVDPTTPPPLQNQDELAAILPSGVTLETQIVPDKLFGENSKTVGEALTALHAHVRDKKIVDGGMGSTIRFKKADEKLPKKGKGDESFTTIIISGQ